MEKIMYDDDDDNNDNNTDSFKEAVERLSRDMAAAARTMGPKEVRFLVDAYYTSQDNRKRAANQARALKTEPHVLIDWLFAQSKILESQIKRSLDHYTDAHIMGSWMRQIVGIGPVISAGLLAHLEEPRPTVGKIYAFAGIAGDDQKPWRKGEKRPYNVRLKTICWHAGQSFMKLSARDDCFYGKLYRRRKDFEITMSEAGRRSELAARLINNVGKTTEAYGHYKAGKLPPSQIDGRARRWAVKIFLSHVNEIWLTRLGRPIPAPFALAHGGHVDYIPPPIPA
jgi:hypothetical protein